MSLTLNGTTQYIKASAAPFTAYPFTLFSYFNPTVANAEQHVFDVCNNTAAAVNGWRLRAAATGLVRETVGNGASTSAVSTSTSYSASTWQKMTMVGNSATSRDVRLNNAGVGSDATNLTPSGIDTCYIGCANLNTVLSQFFSGSIAHMAGWDVALTSTELSMLQAGISPWFVRRGSLKFYLPVWNSTYALTDMVGTLTWTAFNTPTYGTDPGIRIPQNFATMGVF